VSPRSAGSAIRAGPSCATSAARTSRDRTSWLDLPTHVWLWRLLRRTHRRVSGREQLWNDNKESWSKALRGRESLFGYALSQQPRRRREYPVRYAGYPLVRLRSQREVKRWMADGA
jgi:hypothetical protein